ncbi:efflux RND transporter periplasmic adaptor subunit [Paenibacillus sp. LHD-38]|uniref:efflux RND transporter periplasmic adaptor subunit n=1 Tax=Paenibacillus sp. LHD-38 TaxID=3072143 RepID=UPI00280D68CA|nr:efflux RND transporter periplasmic adaptor subunit [Paenibacillus sp. LHD-38]MDQ8734059.1 efflux RND transporter periplasmic adaptor subunit [Paenibacillus sp. LHD-38]
MKKWTIGLSIIIILAAAGAGAYYFYFAKEKEAAGETPTSRTVTATKGSILKQISGTGSVAANSRETVTAGKSGTIATVNVKKGDKIKAGQILVTFEAAEDNEDKISTIEKSITKLEQSIEEYQENYKEATGTENEEATKQSLQKNIEDANTEIADYEEQLQDIYDEQAKEEKVVSASIDGEITEMYIEVGDEVNANTTVATIVDYTKLEFVTSVDELDISSVKVGQAVDLSLSAITDHTIDATVSEIAMEGTSNNGSSAFEVNILLTDIEGVKVGMSGEAAITIASKENIVLVPVNAVVEMGTKSFVRIPSENGEQAAAAGGQQQGRTTTGSGAAAGGQQGAASGQAGVATGERPAAGQGTGAAAGGQQGAESRQTGAASGEQPAAGQGTGAAAGGQRGTAGQAGANGEAGAAAGGGFAAGGRAGGRMQGGLEGQLVEVTTGLSDASFVEIVSGLAEGDSVLVPIAQGTAGMGTETEEMTMQQGFFPGGGMAFPGGGTGGMAGGGGMRNTTSGGAR